MWYYRVVIYITKLLYFLGRPLFLLITALFRAITSVAQAKKSNMWQNTKIALLAAYKVAEKLNLPRPPEFVFRKRFLITATLLILIIIFSIKTTTFLKSLPSPEELLTRKQPLTTKIYARDGQLLFKIFKNQNRTKIALGELPPYFVNATIAIEDAEFYKHHGLSLRGILRAIGRNLGNGQQEGGSTITQQLVKNTLLTSEKTLLRKIKEAIIALKVEATFTKDQILEMYLNEVPYGGATYGIEEASQVFFGKSAKDLTLAESTLLAGLPKAPTIYSPFGLKPELARARQLEVIARMLQEGFITQKKAEMGTAEKLHFAPQTTDIKAPHFVMYVKYLLVQEYGERMVEEGGLSVTTTLELPLQEEAQKVVAEEVERAKNLRISNGAALITNPKTGEILAMIGSKDYFDEKIDGNFNITTAQRQPGSSIKPVNYLYAIESGKFTPASMLQDSPITYQVAGSPAYSPKNYDGTFRGNVTLRTALGSSLNVPAVKVLASYGVEKMLEQAKTLGITTWSDPKNYGLSLTLGGGEVKMIDMATVYAVIANYGGRVNSNPILKVEDATGKVLGINPCASKNNPTSLWQQLLPTAYGLVPPLFAAQAAPFEAKNPPAGGGCSENAADPRAAFIITNILTDNNARTPAFGPNSLLVIPNHPEVAVKTGTTQNLRDNWAIGYTKDYVVVTWVGNNDNTPMSHVASGVSGATPIWHRIFTYLLADQPSKNWEVPQGISEVPICPFTGTLPCEGCPAKTEYFIEGTAPTYACRPEDLLPKEPQTPTPQIL